MNQPLFQIMAVCQIIVMFPLLWGQVGTSISCVRRKTGRKKKAVFSTEVRFRNKG